MVHKIEDVLPLFSMLINRAQTVLNISYSEIKEIFPDSPICFMDYNHQSGNNKMAEIRFDDEGVTLSCMFNEYERCNCSLLFFDNDEDIDLYINLLNNLFAFDLMGNCWMLDHCSMSLRKMDESMALMCY